MASGVLRRTAMMCHHEDGVYDSGWRRCVTVIGHMVEPTPISLLTVSNTDAHDQDFKDMIGHVDDLEWTRYKDRNLLSGTESGVQGSSDGWVHGGISVLIDNPNNL